MRVAQFAAPTYDEKRHHFLWRFWPTLPGWGGMAVLDRSWYGRVLVERVEGFAAEEQWRRAYGEIVDLETTLAAEGMVLVKFWLHVSAEEQLRRFESRRDDPYRAWKLTDDLPTDDTLGSPMPQGEAIRWTMIPQAEIDAITCWIAGGAP